MSKRNSNNTLFFLSGALLGAAVTYYLRSDEGKKLVHQVYDKGNDLKKTIESKAGYLADQTQESIQNIINSTTDAFESTKEKLVNTAELGANKIEDQLDGFEAGVQKAQMNLATKI